ncbi:hypothetical protein BDF20DRAFT_838366 [Mycotypha africana]|uniref:uncharacterized protein n=1 Tax=Mycotypha africana TaxID=64632 RepID=UPI002300EE56|nr:uncharacterized protein BDF20DRAFT_838366 [Mycotypha africana]KAI8969949.1 hypothetical protein BDF20DRAFT_838366 [Mycotypha africana]
MYPIYFEQQIPSCYHQRRPYSMMDNYLSAILNEQQQQAILQAAVRQEKERRRRLQQQQEEERIRNILLLRRRQEQELQAYYTAIKREQEAIRRRQQQEEAYYAALCQQRQKELEQQEEKKTDPLLNLLFGMNSVKQQYPNTQLQKEQESTDTREDDRASEEVTDKDTILFDDFIDHIREKARQLDDDSQSTHSQEQDDDKEVHAEDDGIIEMAIDHIDDHEESSIESSQQEYLGNTDMSDDLNSSNEERGFTQFPEEDPAKLAKYEALNQIEEELNEIRQKHEDHILHHTTLDFSNVVDYTRTTLPDTLSASSAENRQFLGYEDQIMKILLKLDAIDSEGDESIRNERKALVKRAETMLERLDDFKQKEWERASSSSHSDRDEDEDMI